jgi:RNA polymerase sigma-70 factor (ECF subfamily)
MRLRSPWNSRRVAAEPEEPEPERASGVFVETYFDIERALASLAPENRLVVWLHDVEGYTHKEIGRLLGRTASYSKSKLARSYELLLEKGGGTGNDAADSRIRPARSS